MATKPEQSKKQQEKTSDWKSKVTAPKQDTRHKTEVSTLTYTQDVTNTRGVTWDSLFLKEKVLMGLYEYGYEKPSPVQEDVIPYALTGKP